MIYTVYHANGKVEYIEEIRPISLEKMQGIVGYVIGGEYPDKEGKYQISLGFNQLFWLANANPKILGKCVKEMYEEFDRLEMRAFIPIDNYRAVTKGEVFV